MNSPKSHEALAAASLLGTGEKVGRPPDLGLIVTNVQGELSGKDRASMEKVFDPMVGNPLNDSMNMGINSTTGISGESKVETMSKPSFRYMVMGKDMVARVMNGNRFDALRINDRDAREVNMLVNKEHEGLAKIKLAMDPKATRSFGHTSKGGKNAGSSVGGGEFHSEVELGKSDGIKSGKSEEVRLQTVDVASAEIVIPMLVKLNPSANKAIRIVEAMEMGDKLAPSTSLEISGGEVGYILG
ncbi:hypothetical protein V6N13_013213 [Hibiscus sabdariffa]|uniref:Uncharacterized protein n=1 Tax=Hibiscus sabdariffa TaxID=183260 RepID=A0ABR2SHE0_9ROSI